MFESKKYEMFGVEIETTLHPGKVILYNFKLGNSSYFTESLEEAVIHIIAHKNDVSSDMARAACKLLNASKRNRF